jgi:hypothetical protein
MFQFNALINNVATGDFGWIDCSALAPGGSIVIINAGAADAVRISVSNSPTMPTDAGVQLGSDVVASSIVKLDVAYRWIKVRRNSAGGTPLVVNAGIFGPNPPQR